MASTESGFRPDPAFAAGSVFAADWALSHVRLQDDARFPWLVLIPRRAGLVELVDLDGSDAARLWAEVRRASALVRSLGAAVGRPVDKLNVAALGNVTRQLHLHVLGRRRDDPLWPDPVWGRGGGEPWPAATRERLLALVGADASDDPGSRRAGSSLTPRRPVP